MPSLHTDVTVADALITASRALVAVAARSIAAINDDVTLPQYRAMIVLATHGSQTVGQLADALNIHPSTATRLCDRLVAKSLVLRQQDEDNRRETNITLADSGRKIVDGVTAFRREEIARIVGRIPVGLREPMISALTAFAEAAGEIPEQSWSLGWS
ncbi:MAG: MarR family transcriptional regulator [Ilumatobacteraceae bacterium]